ncbi:hypothetical protein NLX86_12580 [Streptomyces sp. A3M-1-3]|uniref:hypothetical protein n=1 Tax=Streptomyces sp. A3M-1-3 TaxID=2962044 RepID=UPI0020B7EAF4|nr:hypothetical protein [Streptomyces sp. A3M-1-3]MCP3818916.1 hypothetical protein [Streptomyces sp. A3M-1-3]
MSDPNPHQNPYADDSYKWGPAHPPGAAPVYGYPDPAYGYPQQPTLPALPSPGGIPLLAIGDITVMSDSIVTPAGTLPLKGAVWTATDMSRTEERIPPAAIVMAVIFFVFCLLGLLFLLMKERTTTGFIQVTVTSGGRHHSTLVPAHHPQTFPMVMGQVNYARSMSF